MKPTIVIARHHENVEWSKSFENVIIYNKGAPLEEGFNVIALDNVGREGHTYYKYIYDHYEYLPEHIIFLQGNPFDHSPNIIGKLYHYMGSDNNNIDFEFISEWVIETNLAGCGYHSGLPLQQVYTTLFDEVKTEMSIIFGAGAQFIVSNKQIWKRPREFYLRIVKMLETSVCPIEGYVIERFHRLICSNH